MTHNTPCLFYTHIIDALFLSCKFYIICTRVKYREKKMWIAFFLLPDCFFCPNIWKGTAFLEGCFCMFVQCLFCFLHRCFTHFCHHQQSFFKSISSHWVKERYQTKLKSKVGRMGPCWRGNGWYRGLFFNGKRHWSSWLITVSCNRAELAWYCMLLYDAKCCHPHPLTCSPVLNDVDKKKF